VWIIGPVRRCRWWLVRRSDHQRYSSLELDAFEKCLEPEVWPWYAGLSCKEAEWVTEVNWIVPYICIEVDPTV